MMIQFVPDGAAESPRRFLSGECLDCDLVSNTCISNIIHAEIRSMPPIGVIILTLISVSANKYKEPENNTIPPSVL